ncbi:hypothetical protein HPB50_018021 [Hyalomma asiaticum]|uniref:Uncharacterized protein n=1 Tax=Hyalomma asiaticum TaxID=266040 RepID=A0ACB7S9W1_HYAAI|nr:hypothetical protein HPB50_018021 [Hyalomma asiaticum]
MLRVSREESSFLTHNKCEGHAARFKVSAAKEVVQDEAGLRNDCNIHVSLKASSVSNSFESGPRPFLPLNSYPSHTSIGIKDEACLASLRRAEERRLDNQAEKTKQPRSKARDLLERIARALKALSPQTVHRELSERSATAVVQRKGICGTPGVATLLVQDKSGTRKDCNIRVQLKAPSVSNSSESGPRPFLPLNNYAPHTGIGIKDKTCLLSLRGAFWQQYFREAGTTKQHLSKARDLLEHIARALTALSEQPVHRELLERTALGHLRDSRRCNTTGTMLHASQEKSFLTQTNCEDHAARFKVSAAKQVVQDEVSLRKDCNLHVSLKASSLSIFFECGPRPFLPLNSYALLKGGRVMDKTCLTTLRGALVRRLDNHGRGISEKIAGGIPLGNCLLKGRVLLGDSSGLGPDMGGAACQTSSCAGRASESSC